MVRQSDEEIAQVLANIGAWDKSNDSEGLTWYQTGEKFFKRFNYYGKRINWNWFYAMMRQEGIYQVLDVGKLYFRTYDQLMRLYQYWIFNVVNEDLPDHDRLPGWDYPEITPQIKRSQVRKYVKYVFDDVKKQMLNQPTFHLFKRGAKNIPSRTHVRNRIEKLHSNDKYTPAFVRDDNWQAPINLTLPIIQEFLKKKIKRKTKPKLVQEAKKELQQLRDDRMELVEQERKRSREVFEEEFKEEIRRKQKERNKQSRSERALQAFMQRNS